MPRFRDVHVLQVPRLYAKSALAKGTVLRCSGGGVLLFGPVCFAMDFLGVCSRCGVHVGAVVGVGWGVVWSLLGVGMGCRGLPC